MKQKKAKSSHTFRISDISDSFNNDDGQFLSMSDKGNRDQIPTEDNAEQTGRALREQESAPGQQREKTVTDFPTAAALGQVLKDVNFPADKNTIARFVEQSNRPERDDILSVIQKLDDRQYKNVSEVAEAAGLSR